MELRLFLGILSAIVDFLAYVFYIKSIIDRENEPNRASWIIWTIVKLFVVVGSFSIGARNTLWLPLSQMIGNGIIAVMAIGGGSNYWSKIDKTCIWLTLTSVVFLFFRMPFLNLIVLMFIETLGVIPTVSKLTRSSDQENLPAWVLIFVATLLSVLSLNIWTFQLWLYPVYLLALNGSILTLVIFSLKRRK